VLFRLTMTRANGLLSAEVGGIKKEIYARGGVAEYVTSNMSSELFGTISSAGVMQGELAMALAMMPHYGGKLGDTLVGLGLLKPLEVFRHLTRQVRSKIIDVCTWNKGGFGWYAGRENQRTAPSTSTRSRSWALLPWRCATIDRRLMMEGPPRRWCGPARPQVEPSASRSPACPRASAGRRQPHRRPDHHRVA
jgi:hypothetical protein